MTAPARRAWLGHHRGRRLFVAALVVAGILFTFGNPARTWYDQHQEITAAEKRIAVLDEQSRNLQARVDQLGTDAEVEAIARGEYGLVMPGEEAFGILPSPGTDPPAPPAAPPPAERSWWERVRDKLTFWS